MGERGARRRSVANAAGWALAGAPALVLAFWLAGRVATDRTHATQYLFWIPTPLHLAGAAVLLGIAAACASRGAVPGARMRAAERWMLRAGALGLVGAAGFFLLVECRLHRLLDTAVAGGRGVRVVCWNAGPSLPAGAIPGPVLGESPDVAIVVNPFKAGLLAGIAEGMAERAGSPVWMFDAGGFQVFSVYPVRRWAHARLGIERLYARAGGGRAGIDGGRAICFELATREALGRDLVVWVPDLPSDPGLARWDVAGLAAASLAGSTDPWFAPAGPGEARQESVGTRAAGFPAPDLVIGDFNTPRGSASLARLLPGLENAVGQAGAGWMASFPRAAPLVHIDQAFVGRGVRARAYRLEDPGVGRHRMQVVEIVPAP